MIDLWTFLKDLGLDIAARVVIWIVVRWASRDGADDMVFMLRKRLAERKTTLVTLGNSLYVAAVDRLLSPHALLRNTATILSATVPMQQAVATFCSASVLIGYADLHLSHLFLSLVPTSLPSALELGLIATALSIFGVYLTTLWVRHVMETYDSAVGGPALVALLLMFAASWAAADAMRSSVFEGLLLILALLVCGFIAYCVSMIEEHAHEVRRAESVRVWGPGGRPFAVWDIRVGMRRLQRAQGLRRLGALPFIR